MRILKDKRLFIILGGLLLALVFVVLESFRPKAFGKTEPRNTVSDSGLKRENESCVSGLAARRAQTIEMSLRERKQLRFELERDGAWAEVSCRITDRSGVPVPDADVRFFFDQPERRPESEGVVEGKSDADGCFFPERKRPMPVIGGSGRKGFTKPAEFCRSATIFPLWTERRDDGRKNHLNSMSFSTSEAGPICPMDSSTGIRWFSRRTLGLDSILKSMIAWNRSEPARRNTFCSSASAMENLWMPPEGEKCGPTG